MLAKRSRRSPSRLWAVLVIAAPAAFVGCGGGGADASYPSARLEGEVTLDGKPIDGGSIQFIPADSKAPPVTVAVLKGRYVAPKVGLGKGTAIVSVAPPERPAVISSSYKPPELVSIPDRYKDGLPVDVQGDKPDQDFALSSRK